MALTERALRLLERRVEEFCGANSRMGIVVPFTVHAAGLEARQ
ncbi:hypothetical protein GCM10009672_17570 [Nesterenkonia lutea]